MNPEEKNTPQVQTSAITKQFSLQTVIIVFLMGVLLTTLCVGLYMKFSTEFNRSSSIPNDIEEYESWALPDDSITSGTSPVVPDVTQEEVVSYDVPKADEKSEPSLFPQLDVDTNDYRGYYRELIHQDGVVWFDHPRFVGTTSTYALIERRRGCVQSQGCKGDDNQAYYQIGTYYGEEILYTTVPCEEMMCGGLAAVFVGTQSKGYRVIVQNSSNDFLQNNYEYTLSPGIVWDKETNFKALNIPESYEFKSVRFNSRWGTPTNAFFANLFREGLSKPEFVSVTPYGPLFRTTTAIHSIEGWSSVHYIIRLPGGLYANGYYSDPFMSDDRVPAIAWNDDTQNKISYRGQTGGCGFGDTAVVTSGLRDADVTTVGRSKTGETIYGLKDANHPFVRAVMEMTDGKYYTYENGVSQTHTYTKEDFLKAHGVITYKDTFGQWRALINSTYGPQAECAKPVIYLYPETEMPVSVSVNAKVTKSEPTYKNGWKAIATPGGTLTVGEKTYSSLFWDGYGYGAYPEITHGIVVPTVDALTTMESQLDGMGFTKEEIRDFIEFWKDHMPSKPYTRITWLLTHEMEELARLTIDPKPDTLIRVFVDFEGLDTPDTTLPLQKLPKFVRNGFTVTEWGGLLRK